MSRHAFKAAKELEVARKAGTAPPAVDTDGKIINPHIPEFISRAPWYATADDGPSLKHQRNHNAKKRNFDSIDKWLPRAQFASSAVTKFRKGACSNCGALTHSVKNCVERPRRRGAKLTDSAIRPDEVIGQVNLDFEGKHDRWNGYDVDNFKQVQNRYAKLEAARNAIKAEKLDSVLRQPKNGDSRDHNSAIAADSDEDNLDDGSPRFGDGAVVQETGGASKTTVRNLRIREDTAKYLYNLDLNSAYYDPKSRSMRGDPLPNVDPNDKDFLGDNFVRQSEDVSNLARVQLFNIRARDAGRSMPHLQAEPSRAEAVFKQFESSKQKLHHKRNQKIIEKYGDASSHSKPDAAIQGVEETEAYVEYNNEGKIISKSKVIVPVSRYAEDVLDKNHTMVWGSYFKDNEWGYGCCYQLQRHSFCTGKEGREAAVETEREMVRRTDEANERRDAKPLVDQWKQISRQREEHAAKANMPPEDERGKRIQAENNARNDKSKGQNTENGSKAHDGHVQLGICDAVTEQDLEQYRLQRHMADDPMAKYLSERSIKNE